MMWRRFALLVVALGLLFLGWCYWSATADPLVREAEVQLPSWPAGAAPVRVVLIADLHVAGPDMPPERLARIVGQINALGPDLVLIAGDFVSDKTLSTYRYSFAQAVAPLAALRPRFGTIAVLGNHDHWRGTAEARAVLAGIGIRVLANEAAQAGPLAVGGLDDAFTGHNRGAATYAAMRRLPGARILLSHSPDPFASLPPDIGLMLAGHTHCGQIRLPFIGALSIMSDHGERYACGLIEENGRTLIVTAGLGTSILPLRLSAPPDLWLVTVGPLRSAGAHSPR